MIAILEAHKAKLFAKQLIIKDIIAGLIVGVVALPLSMAFAIASGAKPENGLYTAIVAGTLTSLFGGSRVQISGPTGAFIVILAGITAKYGFAGLQIATFMAGIILLVLGFSKMGGVIRFIPEPVIVGFTSGIAVIIFVGQWREFFGLPNINTIHFHEKLFFSLQNLPNFHLATFTLALSALFILIVSAKIKYLNKIPSPLIALVVITLVNSIGNFPGVRTIGSAFGGIPVGLPSFVPLSISFADLTMLIGAAFTIAILCAIESLLSAVVADGMTNTKHDSNQELIGQGIANLIVPFFGGFAATGAIARTATNIRNGGSSPLAGIVHALCLVLILLIFAPLAENVPLAALSAILFIVAWNMADLRHVKSLWKKAPLADNVILWITLILTVFTDLVIAVNIGVIIATMHFMRRMSTSVEVRNSNEDEFDLELHKIGLENKPEGLLIFTIEGPFFFGAVENFQRALANTKSDPKVLIIRLRWVPFMDITGIQALEEAIHSFHSRGVQVILSDACEIVAKKLHKSGIVELVSGDNFCDNFTEALIIACNKCR